MLIPFSDYLVPLSNGSVRALVGCLDDLGSASSLARRLKIDAEIVDLSSAELAELVDALGRWHAVDGRLPDDAAHLLELAAEALAASTVPDGSVSHASA